MKNLIMILLCFCFLAHLDRANQTMMFCNEIGNKTKLSEMDIKKVTAVTEWRKDTDNDKEDCSDGCSYWRILKTSPDETICVEIQYNFGAESL